MKLPRILITNPKHPHFEKVGVMTGKVVTMAWGEKIAEVKLDAGGACFISNGDAKELAPTQSGETKRYPPIQKVEW